MDECVSYHTEIVFWDRLADTLGKAAKAGQALVFLSIEPANAVNNPRVFLVLKTPTPPSPLPGQ